LRPSMTSKHGKRTSSNAARKYDRHGRAMGSSQDPETLLILDSKGSFFGAIQEVDMDALGSTGGFPK